MHEIRNITITPEILKFVADIDEFKGYWTVIKALAPERLTASGTSPRLRAWGGVLPQSIRYDNGPELTSRHFLAWNLERKINLVHTQPGKPTQNGYVESFNGKLREESPTYQLVPEPV